MGGTSARRLLKGAVVASAILLSACAQTQVAERHVFVDGLNVTMMNTVMVKAFGDIKERAYEDPDVDTLFTAALGNLNTIDPDIKVGVARGRINVTYRDQNVGGLRAPKDSISAWSFTSIQTLMLARKASAAMRAVNEEAFYKAVFNGAFTKLDGYSRYASHEEAARNRLLRDGVIGLGARVETHPDGVIVQSIMSDGPADQAGLRVDDIITHADGESLARKPLAEARRRLDGSTGSAVTLSVYRADRPDGLIVIVTRDLVVPDTVTSVVNDGVLELHVRSFNQRTAYAVEKAINTARREHPGRLKGIVLDLRSDPGGLLDQAIDIADLFLSDGTIATLHGRHPGAHQYYAARRGDVASGLPLAIVIDGKSASAAEITAAALQDNRRAAVVGTGSWGKGSVQTVLRLPNGGEIALTWAHTVTPRGAALHGLGLLPDVCLSGDPASVSDVLGKLSMPDAHDIGSRRLWQMPPDEPAAHVAMRAICPAEPRPDRAIDMEVARRIVSDPALRALAMRDVTAQLATKP